MENNEKTQIQIIEDYLKEKYDFRYNEISCYIEYKAKESNVGIRLNDNEFNSLIRELKYCKIKVKKDDLWTILFSNFVKKYNPFKNYFDNLPNWDKEKDFITELANTVQTSNQELWIKCFRKWFVGVVACICEDNQVNDTAIIFRGEQGKGKTSWQLKLAPKVLKEYVFVGIINPQNKDSVINLAECMFIILDEQANFNKRNVDALKSLMTQKRIKFRRPYDRINDSLVRKASFLGSVNGAEFLNDETGNRRFLCFDIKTIDYLHNVDIDLAYSQALSLYKSGFRHWFDDEKRKEIELNNESFRVVSLEEEYLLKYFDRSEGEEETSLFLTTNEVIAKLSEKASFEQKRFSAKRLGAILNKQFIRTSKNNRYGYLLREKESDNNSILGVF